MKRLFFVVVFLSLSSGASASSAKIRILWGQFSTSWTLKLVTEELQKGAMVGESPILRDIETLNMVEIPGNPFGLTNFDFSVGPSRPYPDELLGPPPQFSPSQVAWFDQAARRGDLPDIFIIAGHQVISEGWHNHVQTEFWFLPTLLDAVKSHASVRAFFDHITLPILWGCNTMTNLEPHGPQGEYLSPQQIRELYLKDPKRVIGSVDQVNTLEFYRARLDREYGIHGQDYEYTRDPKAERCEEKPHENCDITDIDRILPDRFLWDGSHLYNYPYMMKRLFPKATVILGYSSASPAEDVRAKIFEAVLEKTALDLKPRKIQNILYPLKLQPGDPTRSDKLNKIIISSLRKNWTVLTDAMNRNRPSGSVTPVYPELDAAGILGAPLNRGSFQYGPYEDRTPILRP